MSTVLNDIWKHGGPCKISDESYAKLMGIITNEVFCPKCGRSENKCDAIPLTTSSGKGQGNLIDCPCGWVGEFSQMIGL